MTVTHYARVAERDLQPALSLGYVEVARDWVPSLFGWSCLLEWVGENPPRLERSL